MNICRLLRASIQKALLRFFSQIRQNSCFLLCRTARILANPATVLVVTLFLVACNTSFAGTPFDFVKFRNEADQSFLQNLEDLAKICDEQELVKQAATTRDWFVLRDPKRQYVFLPQATDPVRPPVEAEKKIAQWYRAFRKLRAEQADWLFDQAKQHHLMYPSLSFRLLHETLHENPDHQQARAMLGYEKLESKSDSIVWEKRQKKITTRKVKMPPALPKKLCWQAQSANFKIITTGDKATAIEVAEKFERWYDVWQQLFFTFWAEPRQMEELFKGDSPRERSRRHVVIVFENKMEYDSRLMPLIPGVEISSGYYDHKFRQSFFFAGEGSDESTWRHELTHQLFQELVRVRKTGRGGPADEHGVWALEGIAMYMESLRDFGPFVTVGGFESPRLQYARLDRFRMQFRPEPELLMQMGLKEFQARPEVAKLYPVSAGYCHYLMDGDNGQHRQVLLDYLHDLYSGKSDSLGVLEKLLVDSETFNNNYAKFLFVRENELVKFLRRPEELSILALAPGDIGDEGADVLAQAKNLELLDLTASNITDAGVAKLAKLDRLSQLFLEKTQTGDRGIKSISSLKNLLELDLTQTQISGDSISHLAELPNLQVLWLTGTQVDDDVVGELLQLKNLQQLEVTGTKISDENRQELKQRFSP